jgi:uncharacterized protein involved in exopolysaccharide biosynthesis
VDAKADMEPNIRQMEEWLDKTQPALFQAVAAGASNAEAVASKMQRVLEKSRLEAKSQWTQWRLQLATALRNALKKNLAQSEGDLSDLGGLLSEVDEFTAQVHLSQIHSHIHTHTHKHTHTHT